jgi:(p)ppGpp synthase/HD superfamily hydrolase
MGVDNRELLIAALLHDVVEDTPTTLDQIKQLFGDKVAFIVESVTQLDIKKHKDKRWSNAHESIEVYAKLAESLGLWVVKTEIEDLSFEYLNFETYAKVKNAINEDKRLSEEEIAKNVGVLKKIIREKLSTGKKILYFPVLFYLYHSA